MKLFISQRTQLSGLMRVFSLMTVSDKAGCVFDLAHGFQ